MNRFSNINWTAFLYGAGWPKWRKPVLAWSYGWPVALFIVWPLAFFGIFIPTLILLLYIPLAGASIYFALQGNSLLLEKIKKLELDPEEEQKERMIAAARQERFLLKGVLIRIAANHLFLSLLPAMRADLRMDTMSDYLVQVSPYVQAMQVVLAMMIIDIIAAGITMLIAYMRGDTKNVLYSGRIPDEVMAGISTKGVPNP